MKYLLLTFFAVCLGSFCVYADSCIDFEIVKISSREGKAVLQDAAGKMKLIQTGDTVDGELTVEEIAVNSVVFNKRTKVDFQRIILRLENGKQTIEQITSLPEPSQPLYIPVNISKEEKELPDAGPVK